MEKVVKASPTKEFFVNMLVRDLMLKQAIIELIDNSIDGARNIKKDNQFAGLKIDIKFDENKFTIEDNCGGIPLDIAANYAFRFGRPKTVGNSNTETTGIFGIGMKRALFKMGKIFSIHSITKTTEFKLDLNVQEWMEKDDNDWDFRFSSYEDHMDNKEENIGTKIEIIDLYSDIAAEFKSESFEKEVIEHIQRRVGLDIVYGIEIIVNEKSLVGNNISLVDSDDMKPIKKEYQDGDVNVKILSGIAPRIGAKYPPEEAGWYIYCNGRLVVAADKSSLTTWKDMENRSSGVVFHNKYAGFRGIVYFSSKHPEKLPWNTTKTGIDETSLVYLRARETMFEFFKIIGNMLDDIKKNTEEEDDGIEETIAKMKGTEMTIENINNVKESRIVNIKNISVNTVPNVTISYKKPKQEAEELKKMLDVKSYKEVGEKTFEYYRDAEC